jgi:hypothetical protein
MLACGAFVLAMLVPTVPAAADLPSSVASRVKRINTLVEAVDTALEADRLMTAQRKIKDANKVLAEIEKRYSGKFDESDPEYVAMLDGLEAAEAKVRAAEDAAAGADAAAKEAEAANEALCAEWIERLRPFVDHESADCLLIGADFNRAAPERQARCRAAFPKARALHEELQSVSFPTGRSMELRNVESSLASRLKYYEEEAADAAQEEACHAWVETLAPYVEVGLGPTGKLLIASPTANPGQIREQEALYEEALAYFTLYKKAEFPLGKTYRLQTIEESLARTLDEFPAAMAESRAMISGDVATRLDGVLGYLERDTAWKTDVKKKPPIVMERDLVALREAIDGYAGGASPDDARLVELRRKLETIERLDAEHRAVRAERTYQRPDGYAGKDLDTLKEKAREVASKAHPKAQILRVTVPSRAWAIEDVLEFTDTSRTALRRRITRSVRSEVVLKDAEARVWLQEVYLGQDRLPDGSWGQLKGHTTWMDRMAEKNVGKAPPQ